VNTATVRVLTANGCEVVIPKLKVLCRLPEHQGQAEQAKALARQMIDSFEGTGWIRDYQCSWLWSYLKNTVTSCKMIRISGKGRIWR